MNSTPQTVVVTGASGFVGTTLLRDLQGAGISAIGLVRARGGPGQRVTDWSEGSLRRALAGATAVVHAASVVHRPGAGIEEHQRFNREGTRALLAAATAEGVGHLVFLSTIKVYGDTPREVIDEQTPPEPQDPYAATKLEAERIVLDAAAHGGPVGTVLRLSPVYGRGDKGNVRRVITAIARRRFVLPGSGATRKSLVHASTVAAAVRAALERRAPGVFVVADRHAPSMRELADAAAAALGQRSPPSMPAVLLKVAALPIEAVCALLGREPPVSRQLIWKSLQCTVCSPRKVEEQLGVDCHVDLLASVRDEVQWLREQSLL